MHMRDLIRWLMDNGFELDETPGHVQFFRHTTDGVIVQVRFDDSVTWVDRFTDSARILDWSAELRDAPAQVEHALIRAALGELPPTTLSVEEADRLAQERPPYPAPSDDPADRCPGKTGWHRPQVEDWNAGNRESTCTWCHAEISRRFADPVWRTPA